MSQTSPRTCRNCGAPLASGQRFCSNCGTLAEEGTSTPTTRSNEGYSPVSDMSTMMSNIPLAPPPPDNQPFTSYPDAQHYSSESTQVSQPQPQTPPLYQSAPDYAKPQSATPILRRIGCGLGVLIILFLALCGTGGYFAFHAIQNAFKTTPGSASNTGSSQGTGIGYGTTATVGTATTTPINTTITYASIGITILDVKQAQSFSDDTSGQSGVLRLDIKEQNATSFQPDYLYSDIMRLILPNQNSISPLNAQADISPDASTTRTNWIDFAVPVTTNVAQTTLLLGKDTQAQMSVPLTSQADLSKYQAKVVTVNKSAQYADLKWTIKTATRSWSNQGKQATKGMYYISLDLSVDNPSSTNYTADWESYTRMKAGDVTAPADSSNIPLTFNAGSSGQEGTVAFLVPQAATSYTFILLQEPSYPAASQIAIDFQI